VQHHHIRMISEGSGDTKVQNNDFWHHRNKLHIKIDSNTKQIIFPQYWIVLLYFWFNKNQHWWA